MKNLICVFSAALFLFSCGTDYIQPPIASNGTVDQPIVPGKIEPSKPPSYPESDGKPIDKALLTGKWTFVKRVADVFTDNPTTTAEIIQSRFFPLYDNIIYNTNQGKLDNPPIEEAVSHDPNLTILIKSGYGKSDGVATSFEFEFDTLEFTQDKFSYRFCDKLSWDTYTIDENEIHMVFNEFVSNDINIIDNFHDFSAINIKGDSLILVNDWTESAKKEYGSNKVERVTHYREYTRVP